MAQFEIKMPKMGESVQEATITKWFVNEGDTIAEDDPIAEIATDKVDSEIPSPVDGKVSKILYKLDDVVPVGEVIAVIQIEGEEEEDVDTSESTASTEKKEISEGKKEVAVESTTSDQPAKRVDDINTLSNRFYSPVVKAIAKQENISVGELEQIEGHGVNGRVQKQDILAYIENRGSGVAAKETPITGKAVDMPTVAPSISAGDEIIEMDRMRKLIARYMVASKHTAPHVTSMVEADVTNIVLWRNKVKDEFYKKEKEKITYMPIFIEAVAKALRDFPGVNTSVLEGDKILLKKNINIGIAVALPSGNLIVPVIKNADQKNLIGLTREMNALADKARNNKLSPDDITGGTFSISNFGSFQNVMGTPIINQPESAILATGTIEKKPAVIETPMGDVIGIRHKMFLSLTYDHRIVDGALGGAFVKRIAEHLEAFDINRTI